MQLTILFNIEFVSNKTYSVEHLPSGLVNTLRLQGGGGGGLEPQGKRGGKSTGCL